MLATKVYYTKLFWNIMREPICFIAHVAAIFFLRVASMISIVDDDPLVRDATVDLLSSLGYPVLAFGSAEEFLNSGQVETTLCLITDQQLPGLDGLGLQNKLVANGNHVAVIVITAFPSAGIQERAMKAGATAFLAKPFEEADLVRAIQTALVRR
jgi:FixJ family two-component response regulator